MKSPTPPAPPAPIHPRHWTPQRQRVFLLALNATRSVAAAAAHAGMSRQSAYRLRARKGAESAFAKAWSAALDWRSLPPLGVRDYRVGETR